ncbi:hypothetical protein [Aneurinibacillus aneurinilyticus]|uniref:Uncharacterized protein n=1 Tax=Aneurinibacillus aneurinilyticus ATCC 12856 TaxID=649747 RepID=U1WQJ0_ANEAE|nr:hypothetical protein [Aneurinibacillus aneurinilyticus]ERI10859.1 hypothetical protein HMPREF0083_01047 [Aneurinibacillus aneurinilyticus ATCC 12856]MED0704906.1 hypothetical protein [Aneurinibacillus aneurinilyticus]MED0724052.1 hypothetical protein [Aneurinibacillus aneurinilyticus]MED0731951.1 hypothetical protein [Aneurinibacillus aneurinilyticus]MED0741519.1 hypothetical protein [Aneurinibacillus aneurinilyticus]
MICRVLFPEKARAIDLSVSLASLATQLMKAETHQRRVTGMRFNKQDKAIEVELEEIPDGKETSEATT